MAGWLSELRFWGLLLFMDARADKFARP